MSVAFDPVVHPRDRRGRWRDVPHYVQSLGIPNVHIVGGAVRDEMLGKAAKDHDFIVLGHDPAQIKNMLDQHGRSDDLIVAGRHVGVRFYPHDADARALAPGGIEFTPPRTEVSTGPGHTDFEIKADASVPFEEDARRRDFTVNAIAKHVDTGEVLDPLGGAQDAKDGVLRAVGPTSFRDDPLRIVRGLRFISQHGLTPDAATLAQMRENAAGVEHLSGERVGPEMDKLLMGAEPMKALRVARDTGVLAHLFPELAPTIGFKQESKYHGLTADEHIFHVVQSMADAGVPLRTRWAGLFHDSGKPESAWLGPDGNLHYYENAALGKLAHEDIGAEKAQQALNRLAHLTREDRSAVVNIVHGHMWQDHNRPDERRARRFLAKHGDMLAHDLIDMKRGDVKGKETDKDERIAEELERLDRFEGHVDHVLMSGQPYRLRDLAINGRDLLDIGYTDGPLIGGALNTLLGHVVGDPALNSREWLTRQAAQMLKKGIPTREASPSGTEANRAEYVASLPGMSSGVTQPPRDDSLTEMDDAESDILNYLRMVRDFKAANFESGDGWLYTGPEDTILKHGKVFRKMGPTKSSYDPEYTTPNGCFKNAALLALAKGGKDRLTYVEGYAMPDGLIPVHHAWLVDRKGFVHDPTWDFDKGTAYIGVPFKTPFVMEKISEGGTYGVFDKLDPREDLTPHLVPYSIEPSVQERMDALGIGVDKKVTESTFEELHPRGRSGQWVRKAIHELAPGDRVEHVTSGRRGRVTRGAHAAVSRGGDTEMRLGVQWDGGQSAVTLSGDKLVHVPEGVGMPGSVGMGAFVTTASHEARLPDGDIGVAPDDAMFGPRENAILGEVVDAVAATHGIPEHADPQVVPIFKYDLSGIASEAAYGSFSETHPQRDWETAWVPGYIGVNPTTAPDQWHLSLMHEWAHYLDEQLLGRDGGAWRTQGTMGFASMLAAQRDTPLTPVMDALLATKNVQDLQRYYRGEDNSPRFITSGGDVGVVTRGDPQYESYLAYLLQPFEVFARAYVQYVGVRSDSAPINRAVAKWADPSQLFPNQWHPDDFGPVASAFDAFFEQLGWRRTT